MQTGQAPARRRAGPLTLILLVLLGALWAVHIVCAKAIGAEDGRTALALLFVYVAAGAVGLLAIAALRSRPVRPRLSMMRFFVISTALGYMGPIFFELLVAPRIDASLFALVAGATPLVTVGIAVAVGRDRLTGALAAALTAGGAAALILLGPSAIAGAGGGGAPLFWVALAFLVPLLYGAGDVFIEAGWPAGLDVHQVAAGEGVVATCWAALLCAVFGVGPAEIAAAAGHAGWPAAGLVATSLAATWLYFALLNRSGAVFVSFASYVTIAAGVIGGVIVFGERPGAAMAAAALLIAAALWLLNRDRARAMRA